jgi:hypothetical protein
MQREAEEGQNCEALAPRENQRLQDTERTRLTLSAIKDRLEKAGIPWVVFAGAAAHCYGSKRKITDVDILIKCEDLKDAKTALRDIDTEGFDVGCGAKILTPQGICFFFLDKEMIEKTGWKLLCGVMVPVMSVEDNIVLKAILQRGKEEGKHDVKDIQAMIKHEKIDREYLKRRIRKCRAEKRVIPLLHSLNVC